MDIHVPRNMNTLPVPRNRNVHTFSPDSKQLSALGLELSALRLELSAKCNLLPFMTTKVEELVQLVPSL